ncbi:MAG: hypothetical protein ACYTFY_11925 [Planctomycetota bacterium]|jgi:predicted amino acid racemase
MSYLSIVEGIILLISGLRLGLPSFPFYGDVIFCLGVGTSLLIINPRVEKENGLEVKELE